MNEKEKTVLRDGFQEIHILANRYVDNHNEKLGKDTMDIIQVLMKLNDELGVGFYNKGD
jgi:hypothetical protein